MLDEVAAARRVPAAGRELLDIPHPRASQQSQRSRPLSAMDAVPVLHVAVAPLLLVVLGSVERYWWLGTVIWRTWILRLAVARRLAAPPGALAVEVLLVLVGHDPLGR